VEGLASERLPAVRGLVATRRLTSSCTCRRVEGPIRPVRLVRVVKRGQRIHGPACVVAEPFGSLGRHAQETGQSAEWKGALPGGRCAGSVSPSDAARYHPWGGTTAGLDLRASDDTLFLSIGGAQTRAYMTIDLRTAQPVSREAFSVTRQGSSSVFVVRLEVVGNGRC
jgi:hypothetical protein